MTARVLVADDAATVRAWVTQVLGGAGYAVESAVNGYEVIERTATESFDLIVIDVNMPRLDGCSVVERLRAQEATAATPMVVMSTASRATDEQRAYDAGANLFLAKPLRPDRLTFVADVLLDPVVRR